MNKKEDENHIYKYIVFVCMNEKRLKNDSERSSVFVAIVGLLTFVK